MVSKEYLLLTLRAIVWIVGGKCPHARMWHCLLALGVLFFVFIMISDWNQWTKCLGAASSNANDCFWTEERIEALTHSYVRMMFIIIPIYVLIELILKPTAEKLTINDELVALAESGVPEAAFALSELYQDCGQEARAAMWNDRAVKLGHPRARKKE